MAQWTKVLLFVLTFSCVNSSRIYQSHDSKSQSESESSATGISADMVEALNQWYTKKKYRYVILAVPENEADDMTGYTAPPEKTYADFIQSMKSCEGPCIGAFEFSWEVPRGQGFVSTSEAAMFTWAPDDAPPKYQPMRMRRKYMSMKMDLTNFRVSAIKKVISRWNPKIIQAGDEDDLQPEWVVPQLRGGRFGNRADNLNSDGKALLDELKKEIAEGPGGAGVPIPDEPDTVDEPITTPTPTVDKPKPTKPNPPPSKPTPTTGGGGHTGPLTPTDKAEMLEIIKHMVNQAFEEKKAEIMESANKAAEKAVEGVAEKAAKEAVVTVFKELATKI